MVYAEVAVNYPRRPPELLWSREAPPDIPSAPSQTFHYLVPPALAGSIAPGQLIWVPFGRRLLQGIVVALPEGAPELALKEIQAIADPVPALTPAQLELARWMSRRYLCRLVEVLLAMLPPGLHHRGELLVEGSPTATAPEDLSPREQALLSFLHQRGRMRLAEVGRESGIPGWRGAVDQLVRKGLAAKLSPPLELAARPKLVRVARATFQETTPGVQGALARAPGQRAVLEYLLKRGPTSISELLAAIKASHSTVKKLADKGLIALEEREVWRDPLAGFTPGVSLPPQLTPAQEAACREIEGALSEGKRCAFLLHGVTGSGKTEIYLRALERALAEGKQAIVAVPEIALTPQTVRRFAARFPERELAVLHSGLSAGERYDEWRKIRAGLADIVVGARSAVFAPLPRLGLIVLDEEHDPSYKQDDPAPRYHAREVALMLAELTGAVAILGSATPSLESYHRALSGGLRLLSLPQRILAHQEGPAKGEELHRGAAAGEVRYLPLPEVEVVDLRGELRSGNTSIFSRALQRALQECLEAGEQAILFLNRRGLAAIVLCRDCGYVARCRRCSTALTLHGEGEGVLICHHCSHRYRLPQTCPQCRGRRMRYLGTGTERVEEELQALLPGVRTLRWDRDVTRKRGSHEAILSRFAAQGADVLIGTQMVAKGLDLPLVTLVGVVNADTALYLPDLRASERTFQHLTQVAGRAGRSPRGGRAIVQTYSPQAFAIQAASRHDYEHFFREEVAFRRQNGYPPFKRLVKLVYSHADPRQAREEAEKLGRELRNRLARLGLPGIDILGPLPPYYQRLRRRYRWQIVLRAEDTYPLLDGLLLPLGWQVDVDPESLL